MSAPHWGRKVALAAAPCALVLTVAACGGDDEETTTPEAGATGGTGVSGAVPTADELVSCLTDAGLDASLDESPVLGLESEHEVVNVPIGDLSEGAVLVVFPGPDQAEAEAQAVAALAGVANTQVAGNVIYGFDAVADETPDDQSAVEGCLP